ncbi:PepSY-associated TM helix domain-containing protein [Psychrobium sp. 1_MG-2023]|uniref:PepSY-associated TM helix domain-containing protein n=1 Tax=Psychrobium sp. 1_MG-2023 TaxID=3062624 RepID=UPI002732F1B6|nr:PepSY-associated TM helix domain-containing protein [Psychrobium sp. 1_MG-2023]MDP2560383.1 PepSY-associated TM helix domain-containing protein [Psychrobium sp. 1_MG-2023]
MIFNLGFIYESINTTVFASGNENIHQQQTRYNPPVKDEKSSGVFLSMNNINQLLYRSESEISGFKIEVVEIEHWQNDNATILFRGAVDGDFSKKTIVQYAMKTGEVIYRNDSFDNTSANGESVLDSLHFANFSDYLIKALFFLLGLGTCYVIISGNLLWLAKQQKRNADNWSVKIVSQLSSGCFAGAFLATALCFIVTRLLPVSYAEKQTVLCSNADQLSKK